MADLSVPVATMVGDSMVETLKTQYDDMCEKIKTLRDNYMDFCEDETEFNHVMNPIEKDPEPYSDGTIKTRPILKKYACALLEKNELEVRMEVAAEAVRDINLTPQQVKADMKRYVSICEKKIAKQEEVCKELQKQVEQLTEVVKCIVSHPVFNVSHDKYDVLTQSILRQSPQAIDFMMEQYVTSYKKDYGVRLINGSQIECSFSSPLHYACMMDDILSVTELLKKGEKIDSKSMTLSTKLYKIYSSLHKNISGNGNYPDYICVTPLEIASYIGSLEMVKFLLSNGAKIGDNEYLVPNGNVGDLVAGCLQTHGSKPVVRF